MLVLIHEVVDVIGLKEIFLVELGTTSSFHQRVLPSRSLIVHNGATLDVVSSECCTFPSCSVLCGHQPLLAFQDHQVAFELLVLLLSCGINVIRIPSTAHNLILHVFRVLALALQDTMRCTQALNDLGRILEHSIGSRLEATVAWRLLREHH